MTPTKQHPVVVTGAAGFIGAALVNSLLRDFPAEAIVGVDEPTYFAQRDCSRPFAAQIRTVSPEAFLELIESGALIPAAIQHMGACSYTDETREDYLDRVNVDYTRRLWEFCARQNVPLVYASSGATYGAGEQGFSDDEKTMGLLQPTNLYGWSKQKADVYIAGRVREGVAPSRWAGLKFFNVYGPVETHKGHQSSVVPHWRKQILETGSLRLFRSHRSDVADGQQSRDFVFIDDVVKVCRAFAERDLRPGIYNVGTGQARSFFALAQALAAAMAVPFRYEYMDTPERLRAHYQYYTQATLERLRGAGYTAPFTELEDGLRQYIQRWPVDPSPARAEEA